MIKKLSIVLLVLFSCCCSVGCNEPNRSRVVRHYNFESYEEYEEFYDIFCDYNQERYVVPRSSASIEITYFFNSVADYDELRTKGYHVNYFHAYMYFEVNNLADQFENEELASYRLKFEAYNVADEYDEVCNNLSEVSFKVKTEQYSQTISIFIGDIEVARSYIDTSISIEDANFTGVMDKIISAYKT